MKEGRCRRCSKFWKQTALGDRKRLEDLLQSIEKKPLSAEELRFVRAIDVPGETSDGRGPQAIADTCGRGAGGIVGKRGTSGACEAAARYGEEPKLTSTSMLALLNHLRKITDPSAAGSVSDAELLGRFVHSRDETAFELLLWRHQRLVMGVCRRVLGNVHDAEDAFQAAFLALARKADSLSRGDAVASWLHTVAFRIALRVRSAPRMQTNLELTELGSHNDPTDAVRGDLAAVLDEEISRLPRKYRVPVVLCYLEGKTNRKRRGSSAW